MLTVSRSVDRVFQIMELFSAQRRPLSATEVCNALSIPHSSTVSVLSRLVDLGYLDQNTESKRFFPSLRLHDLCGSVPEAIIPGSSLAELTDRIQNLTDETTSISRLDGLLTLPIYVRSAKHAYAWRVTPGLHGGLATLSVVGRTLLSTLPAAGLTRFLERARYWANRSRVVAQQDVEPIMRAVDFVREHGYLCGYNLLMPGVGAICVPLPMTLSGNQLAITVAGSTVRVQQRSRQIITALLREIHASNKQRVPAPGPARVQSTDAQRV